MSPQKRKQEDLPASVKNSLPPHAQDIYKKAHDNALERYKNPEERRGNESREAVANKVAWAAVKKEYRRVDKGEWEKK